MARYRYAKLRGSVSALPESGEGPLRQIQIVEGDIVEDGVLTHKSSGNTSTLAPGEVERLLERGSFVREGELTGTERAIANAKTSTAAKNEAAAEKLDLSGLAGYEPGKLAELWAAHPPKVKDVLKTVGDNVELAQKVLDAEKGATKGDGRPTLVGPLEALVTPEAVDLAQLAEYEPEKLAELWKTSAPTVSAAVDAVGDNVELAQKVLDAEKGATTEPRSSLVKALDKVIAGAGQ